MLPSCHFSSTCVNPGISRRTHIPKGNLVHIYNIYYNIYINVFRHASAFFLFRPRVFPRALGSMAHREPARTPYASLGPGRGPWHVLWGLKVARPLGEAFRARRAIQVHTNPHVHNTSLIGKKNVRRLIWYLGPWMPSMSSDITYLVMEKFFLDMSDMQPCTLYLVPGTQLICVPLLRN